MTDPVNLRQARKRKAAEAARALAAENRARHGRTAAQKAFDAKTEALARARLDAAERE